MIDSKKDLEEAICEIGYTLETTTLKNLPRALELMTCAQMARQVAKGMNIGFTKSQMVFLIRNLVLSG